jgi:hypothetical protein
MCLVVALWSPLIGLICRRTTAGGSRWPAGWSSAGSGSSGTRRSPRPGPGWRGSSAASRRRRRRWSAASGSSSTGRRHVGPPLCIAESAKGPRSAIPRTAWSETRSSVIPWMRDRSEGAAAALPRCRAAALPRGEHDAQSALRAPEGVLGAVRGAGVGQQRRQKEVQRRASDNDPQRHQELSTGSTWRQSARGAITSSGSSTARRRASTHGGLVARPAAAPPPPTRHPTPAAAPALVHRRVPLRSQFEDGSCRHPRCA